MIRIYNFLSCLPHLQCQSCLVFCRLVIPVLNKKCLVRLKQQRCGMKTNNSWLKLHFYFASFIQLKNTTLDLFLKQRGLHSAVSPACILQATLIESRETAVRSKGTFSTGFWLRSFFSQLQWILSTADQQDNTSTRFSLNLFKYKYIQQQPVFYFQ